MKAGIDTINTYDQSVRAEGILDYILEDAADTSDTQKESEVSVADALKQEQLIKKESQRVRSRVLFVTRDRKVLETGTLAQQHFAELGDVFDEVHVIVLGTQRTLKEPSLRIAPKVWLYPTTSSFFLQQPFTAVAVAKYQLQFTDGFRPDIVIALDAFESAAAGYLIARKFDRTFQVHITEDFLTDAFIDAHPHNKWRLRFARYVLRRTVSVRVHTDLVKNKVAAAFPKIGDLALLPRYFNIQGIIASIASSKPVELYPQFAFTVLFVGPLTPESTLFRAIDAVRMLLQTPSIGFVIIGEGKEKALFQERTRILGIDTNIIFTPKVDNLIAHMQSADILICTDTTSESEEVVVKAAAAGLPMIMARTPLRDDLFTDDVDAFLCDPDDTIGFSQKLRKFLNTNTMRIQFAQNAKDIVRTRLQEDPHMYRLAYRDSIEEVLYLNEAAQEKRAHERKQKREEKERRLQAQEAAEKASIQKKVEKASDGVAMVLPKVE